MLFIESIEAVSVASFSPKNQKILPLQRAVIRVDTIKIFLQIAWEMKLIDTKRYIALSEKIAIIGKMLGGWYGQILKQNSPATVAKEK